MTDRPTLDFTPGNMAATGGIIGDWCVTYADGSSITAGQKTCLEDAAKRGFRSKDLTWTKAARAEFFRQLRRRYGRGRR